MSEELTPEQNDDPRKRNDWAVMACPEQMVLLLGAILDTLEDTRRCVIAVESEVMMLKETVRYG